MVSTSDLVSLIPHIHDDVKIINASYLWSITAAHGIVNTTSKDSVVSSTFPMAGTYQAKVTMLVNSTGFVQQRAEFERTFYVRGEFIL